MLEQYESLVRSLAVTLGLNPQELLRTEEIVIDDLPVGFQYEGDEEDGDILFFAPLGQPEQGDELPLYKALLQANHLWIGTGGGTLALHPFNGEAVLAGRLPLHRLDAEHFSRVLEVFAQTALFWRVRVSTGGFPVEPSGMPVANF